MHMCTRTRIHRAPTHTHTHTPAVHPCLRAVCSMAHLLTPDVETCAARNARLVLETAKFVLALNKDQAQQYLDKVCLCLWLWRLFWHSQQAVFNCFSQTMELAGAAGFR